MAWLNHFWKFSCGFFADLLVFPCASPPNPATSFLFACLSLERSQCSSSSEYPVSASNLLTIEFALEVRCDPKFSGLPKAIHFAGEVFGK